MTRVPVIVFAPFLLLAVLAAPVPRERRATSPIHPRPTCASAFTTSALSACR